MSQPAVDAAALRWTVWLALAMLTTLALINLLGTGSYKGLVYAIVLFALLRGVAFLRGAPGHIPAAALLLLAPLTFLLCDQLAPEGESSRNAYRNLPAFLAVAATVWMLPAQFPPALEARLRLAFTGMLAVAALANSAAILLFGLPFGLHENPHFVSLGAAVTVPVMVHALRGGRVLRTIGTLGLAAALVNLFSISSIIGWLAIALALAVTLLIRLRRPLRRILGVALGLLVLAVLLHPPLHPLYDAPADWVMERALPDQPRDERFELWEASWALQLESTGSEWLVGHGLGGFEEKFQGYSRFELIFPHHFPLEVLFNSGVIGLLAFLVAVGALVVAIVRGQRPGHDSLILAIALLVAVGCFAFLTLPIASQPTAHFLGFTVGFTLWTLRRGPRPALSPAPHADGIPA